MADLHNESGPAVYRIDAAAWLGAQSDMAADNARIRTAVRALTGMQKEAITSYGPSGDSWRLVCDEGPWLNGTDLAPFPLAFFTAGMAASYLSAFMMEAKQRLLPITALEITQENFFTMAGSALRGTMQAGLEPVRASFRAAGDAQANELTEIANLAVQAISPLGVLLGNELESQFAITANGEPLVELPDKLRDPSQAFAKLPQVAAGQTPIIRKDFAVDPAAGAAAVGLQPSQKRRVEIMTRGRVRADGLFELAVQCLQPAGSRFIFLSDNAADAGGQGRAPNPLTYISCGIAFCFMTQLGRYAEIVKQQLRAYRVVQDTGFGTPGQPAALPVSTHVFLDTDEPADASRKLVQMGEQTCYLHAACRIPTETRIRLATI